ncbi:GDSL esterase/lipase [Camellia lanceoleosa]|uniref:GDSL esterase/lipase n=1 Tax=Camellia lanceoleosa TaxID=1840588 RepID=A0ACC0GS77_9ERIC|nr:GDSL esterase/lipase [Camellia lanceoleosa]
MHLIPSANLVVNLFLAQDMKQAHGIHQWWRPDLNLRLRGSEPPYSKTLSLDDNEKRATKPIAAPPPPMLAAAAEKHSLPTASGNPYWTAGGLPLGHGNIMGEPLC